MNPRISSHFDGGAITVIDATRADDIQLSLRPDSHADIRQWFYFRLQGAAGTAARIRITDAGQATYVGGWRGYSAVASYDRLDWFRVPTQFDGSGMVIEHSPSRDSVYYAYFEPYSWERHLACWTRRASPRARVADSGATVEGRDLQRS